MKKSDYMIISMALSLLIITCAASFESFSMRCANIREDTLRLHIIANSDSQRDQALKLAVRDRILSEYGEVLGSCTDLSQSLKIAQFLLPSITQSAGKALSEQGVDCPVNAYITDMFFETRQYDNIVMPAGTYKALRVELGSAHGQNWWCVMYPPLCIPMASQQQASDIQKEIDSLNHVPNLKAKLAIVEIIEKFKPILTQ